MKVEGRRHSGIHMPTEPLKERASRTERRHALDTEDGLAIKTAMVGKEEQRISDAENTVPQVAGIRKETYSSSADRALEIRRMYIHI